MFSKHVWYDRKHQAEVYTNDDGVTSGTLVAYEGAVCAINPRPEVLAALYQEAKIRKIVAVKAVILTSDQIDFTRGLCAFVNYCRGLRRRSPLMIISPEGHGISHEFFTSCCAKLWWDSAFELGFTQLEIGEDLQVGKGTVHFKNAIPGDAASRSYLEVATEKGRVLHYYDESHHEAVNPSEASEVRPNVVIRAAQLPSALPSSRMVIERFEV